MYVDVSGQRREFHYYLEARHNDGLLKREIQIGKKISEWYEGREDNLKFRSIEFFFEGDEEEDDIDINDRYVQEMRTRETLICTMVRIMKLTCPFILPPASQPWSSRAKSSAN